MLENIIENPKVNSNTKSIKIINFGLCNKVDLWGLSYTYAIFYVRPRVKISITVSVGNRGQTNSQSQDVLKLLQFMCIKGEML